MKLFHQAMLKIRPELHSTRYLFKNNYNDYDPTFTNRSFPRSKLLRTVYPSNLSCSGYEERHRLDHYILVLSSSLMVH